MFKVGDIIRSQDAPSWIGFVQEINITSEMVYVVWFHEQLFTDGWFPSNILERVT